MMQTVRQCSLGNPPDENPAAFLTWRFDILPYLDEQPVHDVLADCSTWRFALGRQGESARPALVPTFQCPSAPSPEPEFLPYARIISNVDDSVIFDAIGTRDCDAPEAVNYQLRAAYNPDRRYYAGAWWGSGFPPNSDQWEILNKQSKDRWREVRWQGALLKRVTDGLSHTVFVGERSASSRGTDFRFSWLAAHRPFGGLSRDVPAINWNRLEQLYSSHNGVHVALCDGAVTFLTEGVSHDVVGSLLARDDASPVSHD